MLGLCGSACLNSQKLLGGDRQIPEAPWPASLISGLASSKPLRGLSQKTVDGIPEK